MIGLALGISFNSRELIMMSPCVAFAPMPLNQLYESDQTTGSVRTPTPGRLGREGRGCGRAAGTAPTGDGTAAAWGAGCTGAGFGAGALYGIGRIFCVLSGSSSTGEPIARINCWKPVL